MQWFVTDLLKVFRIGTSSSKYAVNQYSKVRYVEFCNVSKLTEVNYYIQWYGQVNTDQVQLQLQIFDQTDDRSKPGTQN